MKEFNITWIGEKGYKEVTEENVMKRYCNFVVRTIDYLADE